MPYPNAAFAHILNLLHMFISNLDINIRSLFIKLKNNKTLNAAGIANTLGELIKKSKRGGT